MMTWTRAVTGDYWAVARGDLDEPLRFYKIIRTPYGKSGYTFEAHFRPEGNSDWTRIPLSFRSRLKDSKAKAEKHLKDNPV